jgi:hypothetical protein
MDKLTKNWHTAIVSEAQRKLGRILTEAEQKFITSREGYMALEFINDTVKDLTGTELINYLNSEHVSE